MQELHNSDNGMRANSQTVDINLSSDSENGASEQWFFGIEQTERASAREQIVEKTRRCEPKTEAWEAHRKKKERTVAKKKLSFEKIEMRVGLSLNKLFYIWIPDDLVTFFSFIFLIKFVIFYFDFRSKWRNQMHFSLHAEKSPTE